MALIPTPVPGATPLDPDEIAGLIPRGVLTQQDLNLVESENILLAEAWLASTRLPAVLDDEFARTLHRKMFDRTWRWAGLYRNSEKNIGIAPGGIGPAMRNLMADVHEQIESRAYGVAKAVVLFHHRLTRIHPFANGNGRHARMLADVMMRRHDLPPFTWGRGDLFHPGEARAAYIAALREADGGHAGPLLAFLEVAD